jgi:hypothetical protein
MSRRGQVQTLLAAGAIALLLSACGGGDTQTPPPTEASGGGAPAQAVGPSERGSQPPSKPNGPSRRSDNRAVAAEDGADEAVPEPQTGSEPRPQTEKAKEKTPAVPAGCPPSLDRRQCREVAAAQAGGTNGGSSRAPAPGECPPGLDPRTCEELEASTAGSGQGQQAPTGSCPPALPQEQCRELEATYGKGGA